VVQGAILQSIPEWEDNPHDPRDNFASDSIAKTSFVVPMRYIDEEPWVMVDEIFVESVDRGDVYYVPKDPEWLPPINPKNEPEAVQNQEPTMQEDPPADSSTDEASSRPPNAPAFSNTPRGSSAPKTFRCCRRVWRVWRFTPGLHRTTAFWAALTWDGRPEARGRRFSWHWSESKTLSQSKRYTMPLDCGHPESMLTRVQGGDTTLTQALAPDGLSLWSPCCATSQNLLKEHRAMTMTMSTHLSPLVALIVGILILIFPRFLNYFIVIYLIVTGLIGLGALRYIGGP